MSHIKIIAEVAQGFEGNFEVSRLLIRAAKKAGADWVKFQLVYADDLATAGYKYYPLFKKLEFTEEQWGALKEYAEAEGMELCVDLFGARSLSVASRLKIRRVKIHPTDITNEQLLSQVREQPFETILVGSGGADMQEIEKCLAIMGDRRLVLLHGYQGYPTRNEDNLISRIEYLRRRLATQFPGLVYGFADHVVGDPHYSVALNAMAYAAGATHFEKHFSLGTVIEMEDFESSINPDEFSYFVGKLKEAVAGYGHTGEVADFGMSDSEKTYRGNIRRQVVAGRTLPKGHRLVADDLALKRTEREGLNDLSAAIGYELTEDVQADAVITQSILKP